MEREFESEIIAFLQNYFSETKEKIVKEETLLSDLRITHQGLRPLIIKLIHSLVENAEKQDTHTTEKLDEKSSIYVRHGIGFTTIGVNRKGSRLFVSIETFHALLKKVFSHLPALLNENDTYEAFQELSGEKEIEPQRLKTVILQATPLIRFFENNRGGAATLNLYRFFYPDRDVFVSKALIETIALKKALFASDEQKSLLRKKEKKNAAEPRLLIENAFSLAFSEIGRLIIPDTELFEHKSFKSYFDEERMQSFFEKEIQEFFPHHPTYRQGLLSLFPENWIDIAEILSKKEGENGHQTLSEKWLEERYPFLNRSEVATIVTFVNKTGIAVNKPVVEVSIGQEEVSRVDTHKIDTIENLEPPVLPQEVFQEETRLKGVRQKESRPFTNVEKLETNAEENAAVVSEENQRDFTLPDEIYYEKTEPNKAEYDGSEPVTPVEIHGKTAEENARVVSEENHVDFTLPSEIYYEKAEPNKAEYDGSEPVTPVETRDKTTEKDTAVVSEENHVDFTLPSEIYYEKAEPNKAEYDGSEPVTPVETRNKTTEKDAETVSVKNEEDFVADLLISSAKDKPIEKEENVEKLSEELISSIASVNDHPSDVELIETVQSPEEMQHGHLFEEGFNFDDLIYIETEKEKTENTLKAISEEKILKPITDIPEGLPERPTNGESRGESVLDEGLKGKIISLLTENEEYRIKIELISKTMLFELRDSLAYRPDIAVFDQDFEYLIPIAKNTGIQVLMLKTFLQYLGIQ
jgi:hypothetical protein